jgi:hypothetical protein
LGAKKLDRRASSRIQHKTAVLLPKPTQKHHGERNGNNPTIVAVSQAHTKLCRHGSRSGQESKVCWKSSVLFCVLIVKCGRQVSNAICSLISIVLLSFAIHISSNSKLPETNEELDKSDNDTDNEGNSSSSSEDDEESAKPVTKKPPQKRKSIIPKVLHKLKSKTKVPTKNTKSTHASKSALTTMAKKYLGPTETTETSLLAALLMHSPPHDVACRVVATYDADPNQAQLDLYNLLFRSVGGSHEHLLSMGDLETDDWTDSIGQLIHDMSLAPHVLFVADCLEETPGRTTVASREYRKTLQDFWHALGTAALTYEESHVAAGAAVDRGRELLLCLTELVSVGQPDIRAAATCAVYEMTMALLERSVAVQQKLSVAKRQHAVAVRSKSTTKSTALAEQMRAWRQTTRDLDELVCESVASGVFGKRVRDSNKSIRAMSLNWITRAMAARPDLFLTNSFLKYFGWFLSDKEAVVRGRAILGLLHPFERNAAAANGEPQVKLSAMSSVINKFIARLTDCVIDVDVDVQEKAIKLLLMLSRQGFLDSLNDDNKWDQINIRAFDPDVTPVARRDSLYFVLEQLESFDGDVPDAEVKTIEQINGLAQW